ncbi:ras family-domain-containing protein [Schizothecium vesticola]|uniref:Ras family-domain-containing protein n=1 Tax=Schizothecium vesticola TaxID=314040 RepID=A0AA40FD12_9PEZI|nr:ras family-domain-containing protein [Schizothecium vesticola]
MRHIDDMDLKEGGRSVRFHDDESMAKGLLRDRDSVLGVQAQQPTMALEMSREFEAVLEQSWVYARTSSNEIDAASFASSDVRSYAWSMLSMNDISIVAVFRLPVTLDDVNCFGSGLTLGGFFGENLQRLDAPDTAETATSSDSSASKIEDHSLFPSWEHLTPRASPQSAAELGGPSIKAVVVGDKRCEKTAAIVAFTTGAKQGEYIPKAFDTYSASLMIHGRLCSLGLWDTSGLEDHHRLRPLAYPQTDIFLVFGRIGIKSTFDSIEGLWIPEISHQSPRIPILIVGISSEDDQQLFKLARQRHEPCKHEDYTKMGKRLAKRIGAVRYMECNISTLYNVKAVFSEAVLTVVDPKRNGLPQSRSKKSKSWRRGLLPGIGETKEE